MTTTFTGLPPARWRRHRPINPNCHRMNLKWTWLRHKMTRGLISYPFRLIRPMSLTFLDGLRMFLFLFLFLYFYCIFLSIAFFQNIQELFGKHLFYGITIHNARRCFCISECDYIIYPCVCFIYLLFTHSIDIIHRKRSIRSNIDMVALDVVLACVMVMYYQAVCTRLGLTV